MTSKIKNIFWDMCGVLIQDSYMHIFHEISKKTEIDISTFMLQIRDDLNLMEQGYINEKELYFRINKIFNLNLDIEKLEKDLIAGFIKNNEIFEVITKLNSKNISNYIISNLGEDIVKIEMKKLNLNKYFKKQFFSSKTKLRKPNHEFFQYALSQTNSTSKESLFIDDKKRNIDVALKLGFKTHHFTDNQTLISYLKKEDLL